MIVRLHSLSTRSFVYASVSKFLRFFRLWSSNGAGDFPGVLNSWDPRDSGGAEDVFCQNWVTLFYHAYRLLMSGYGWHQHSVIQIILNSKLHSARIEFRVKKFLLRPLIFKWELENEFWCEKCKFFNYSVAIKVVSVNRVGFIKKVYIGVWLII